MRNSLKLLAPISLIAALAACSEAGEEAATEEFATAEGEYAPSPAEDAVAEMATPPAQAGRRAPRLPPAAWR